MAIRTKSFFSNKVQEIHTTYQGVITQSSNTIFVLNEGDNIYDLHPFFESLKSELSSANFDDLAFPCVQLDTDQTKAICDITIKKERSSLAILLFDYSTHYEHLHDAAQEKKTAMLNEQAHELNVKYSEEKKVYLEFIQDRIENKIVQEIEEINSGLKQLEKTDLSSEQSSILKTLKKKITILYSKAEQIKDGLKNDIN